MLHIGDLAAAVIRDAGLGDLAGIDDTILNKLKSERSDDFIGKLFETYAAAAFLKASFHLGYEDEDDSRTSHVEFVATYPKTRKKFSVEVKSRNRSSGQDGLVDDVKRLRVGSKLNRALGKEAKFTRVVMIEVNVPDVLTDETKSTAGLVPHWPRSERRRKARLLMGVRSQAPM